jgi:hypothetical protein
MNTKKFFITQDQAKGIALRSRIFTKEKAQRILAIKRKKVLASKGSLIKKALPKAEALGARVQVMQISMDKIMNEYAIPSEQKTFLMKLAEKMARKENEGKIQEAKKIKSEIQRDVGLIINNEQKGQQFANYLERIFNINWNKTKKYFLTTTAKK